ncbi:energy-coupling factor transporter transmembrane component T family protein [Blastococcus sp. PRF04-17]|uniref:energy-coupling factor transporter transmembrane component T family protein n=1 Tax=Blastococcus sp. PRF04-17 TaxID=2933797 RepID=UPI001FF56CEA|nr:energy-coupling factor transporter transmembrane protein EcfT [Blastococcus sp. PRF04-17]UOY03400.1 energy-coupling factor transporter transmembrane protein EcfT [Blastococcus sp. PRF04-17]
MTLALYVPRASLVHRAPAGAKLLALVAVSVLLFVVPTLPVVTGALVLVVLVGLVVAQLPVVTLARQARAVLWWLVAIFVLHAFVTDLATGTLTVMRLLALVLAAAVVTATTRVSAMVAVVERVCRPLSVVGVRPARIGLVIAMALRFIPLLIERADRIREAQAARGGTLRGLHGLRTSVVPLLVQVLQLAHTVAEALDARGADDVPVRRRGARAA